MENNVKNCLLAEMRRDLAHSQKKGLHFLLSAALIWTTVFLLHTSKLTISTKNILTMVCSAPMFMIAMLFARLIKVNFFERSNPLSSPGIMFAMNQMLYIPISVWMFYECPEKMLMAYAVVTGAHLFPFAWLYCSNVYLFFSVTITIAAITVGWLFPSAVLAAVMLLLFVVFCICLFAEYRKDEKKLD